MPRNSASFRQIPEGAVIIQRLLRACRERGWDRSTLAKKAGISRTTLYHLERNVTRNPRISTLTCLAQALEMDPDELFRPAAGMGIWDLSPEVSEKIQTFDRDSNPVVNETYEENAHLFTGWSADEWDELFSTFGTGGSLSASGVIEVAEQINKKRETLHRTQILLETHLHDLTVRLIDGLFELINPSSVESENSSTRSTSPDEIQNTLET
ncbi:MAG: hypothetical protein Tsb009_29110 [Planctomycetaceae bacterium]